TAKLFAVTPDGKRIDFAAGADGTYVRALAFAPVTPETRRAGIAGGPFVVPVSGQGWAINGGIRGAGPFHEFLRQPSTEEPARLGRPAVSAGAARREPAHGLVDGAGLDERRPAEDPERVVDVGLGPHPVQDGADPGRAGQHPERLARERLAAPVG